MFLHYVVKHVQTFLDNSFIEHMNTLLDNAEVPDLFEDDEYASLMTTINEGAQRLNNTSNLFALSNR